LTLLCVASPVAANASCFRIAAILLSATANIKDVMAEVQPLARQTVEAAAALRADVSKLKILKKLRVGMTAAEARAAGVTVLREDDAGIMTVGTFEIPRLDGSVVTPPKSECVCNCV